MREDSTNVTHCLDLEIVSLWLIEHRGASEGSKVHIPPITSGMKDHVRVRTSWTECHPVEAPKRIVKRTAAKRLGV